MDDDIYYRVEVTYYDAHGCGVEFGHVMEKHGLEATPYEIKESCEHWFTPKGAKKFLPNIKRSATASSIPIKIRKNKLSTLKKKKIKYQDEYQIAVERY